MKNFFIKSFLIILMCSPLNASQLGQAAPAQLTASVLSANSWLALSSSRPPKDPWDIAARVIVQVRGKKIKTLKGQLQNMKQLLTSTYEDLRIAKDAQAKFTETTSQQTLTLQQHNADLSERLQTTLREHQQSLVEKKSLIEQMTQKQIEIKEAIENRRRLDRELQAVQTAHATATQQHQTTLAELNAAKASSQTLQIQLEKERKNSTENYNALMNELNTYKHQLQQSKVLLTTAEQRFQAATNDLAAARTTVQTLQQQATRSTIVELLHAKGIGLSNKSSMPSFMRNH